jgi:hypothetical protein
MSHAAPTPKGQALHTQVEPCPDVQAVFEPNIRIPDGRGQVAGAWMALPCDMHCNPAGSAGRRLVSVLLLVAAALTGAGGES